MSANSRNENRRTWEFKEQLKRLPVSIQERAEAAFEYFCNDPTYNGLHVHVLKDNKRGQHYPDSFSVRIDRNHRAIFRVVESVNLWYWVGTHKDYDTFTGIK